MPGDENGGGYSCCSCCWYLTLFALILLFLVFNWGGNLKTYFIIIGILISIFIFLICLCGWILHEDNDEPTHQVNSEPTADDMGPFQPPQVQLDQDNACPGSSQGLSAVVVYNKSQESSSNNLCTGLNYNMPTPSAPPIDDMDLPPPSFEEAIKSDSVLPPLPSEIITSSCNKL